MGALYYGGSASPIRIDDRVLAHLMIVVITKLRRGESFTMSWPHPDDRPPARSAIWLHPAVPLRFEFEHPDQPQPNRQYLADLANAANTSGGIRLGAEDVSRCRRTTAAAPG